MDDAARRVPLNGLGLVHRQLELLVARIAELLAEFDDTGLAATGRFRQRGRGQGQHLLGMVDDELGDLAIGLSHGVELGTEDFQNRHCSFRDAGPGPARDPSTRADTPVLQQGSHTRPGRRRAANHHSHTNMEYNIPCCVDTRNIHF